jgi:hypothetical protein
VLSQYRTFPSRREETLAIRGKHESRLSLFGPQHLILITSLVEESKGLMPFIAVSPLG